VPHQEHLFRRCSFAGVITSRADAAPFGFCVVREGYPARFPGETTLSLTGSERDYSNSCCSNGSSGPTLN